MYNYLEGFVGDESDPYQNRGELMAGGGDSELRGMQAAQFQRGRGDGFGPVSPERMPPRRGPVPDEGPEMQPIDGPQRGPGRPAPSGRPEGIPAPGRGPGEPRRGGGMRGAFSSFGKALSGMGGSSMQPATQGGYLSSVLGGASQGMQRGGGAAGAIRGAIGGLMAQRKQRSQQPVQASSMQPAGGGDSYSEF
jgi:hypothetical protein